MSYNTIKVKKYSDVIEEYVAGGTITPGHLIALNSAGKVVVHAGAGANVLPMFALENELIGESITDDYLITEPVQCWIPYRGDEVYALLADGESVAIGDFLISNGAGALAAWVGESAAVSAEPVVAVALEAVDLTDSANLTAVGRILVKII